MRNYFIVFFVSASFVFGDVGERPGYVSVLLYHRFGESKYPSTNIDTEMFRSQMQYLRDEGYTVLNMEQFRSILKADENIPPKSVLVTIDDSFKSIYDHAFPILKEFDYPFTLFVDVRQLSSGSPGAMNWVMLKEMYEWGATVGNHGYKHDHLGIPQLGQTRENYREWVFADLYMAQKKLNEYGLFTDIMAYPYGEYNEVVISVAKELGFNLMFAQDEGAVGISVDRTRIPRLPIVGSNMDKDRFEYKLNLSPLHVTDMTPDLIELVNNPPSVFSFRLLSPERYRPGIINAFISEIGLVEATYSAETGVVSYRPEEPLLRSVNRFIITAREKNSPYFSMFSRLYIRPFDELGIQPDSLKMSH